MTLKNSVLSVLMISFLAQSNVFAAEIPVASIPKTGAAPEQFCPPGWKLEAKLTADLQGNGSKDQVIQLITQKPIKDGNGTPANYRALIVAFAKDGKLELADWSPKFLLCSTCGGQLGASIAVSGGKNEFSVDQGGGGGNDSFDYNITFRYDQAKKQFVVSKADVTTSTDRVSNNSVETVYDYVHGTETVTTTVDDKEKKSTKKFSPKIILLRDLDATKLSSLFKG